MPRWGPAPRARARSDPVLRGRGRRAHLGQVRHARGPYADRHRGNRRRTGPPNHGTRHAKRPGPGVHRGRNRPVLGHDPMTTARRRRDAPCSDAPGRLSVNRSCGHRHAAHHRRRTGPRTWLVRHRAARRPGRPRVREHGLGRRLVGCRPYRRRWRCRPRAAGHRYCRHHEVLRTTTDLREPRRWTALRRWTTCDRTALPTRLRLMRETPGDPDWIRSDPTGRLGLCPSDDRRNPTDSHHAMRPAVPTSRNHPNGRTPQSCRASATRPRPEPLFTSQNHPTAIAWDMTTTKKQRGPFWEERPSLRKCVRRRPTLPRSGPRSTIGAERLSFRVRDGTGRFPLAMVAETLWRCGPHQLDMSRGPYLGNRTVDA